MNIGHKRYTAVKLRKKLTLTALINISKPIGKEISIVAVFQLNLNIKKIPTIEKIKAFRPN